MSEEYRGVFYFADGTTVDTRPKLEERTATQNGVYTPSAGKDGISKMNVDVPSSPSPTGSLYITQNGSYNVTDKATAVVDVAGTQTETLYPAPSVAGWTDAFRIRYGEKKDLSRKFGAGQTFVVFPVEPRCRVGSVTRAGDTGCNCVIDFPSDESQYHAAFSLLQSGSTLNITVVKKKTPGVHSTVSIASGTTYGWYAARFTPTRTAIGYTVLCNATGGKMTGSTSTDLYTTAWGKGDHVTNFMGMECVVVVYPDTVSISDADLERLANQYNGFPAATKFWTLTVDDTRTAANSTVDDVFSPYGVKPGFAIRADYLGNYLEINAVKAMHDRGYEILYHGMQHDTSGWGVGYGVPGSTRTTDEDDIDRFLELMYSNGISVRGFCGPHMSKLIESRRNRFWYARPMLDNDPTHGDIPALGYDAMFLDSMGTPDSTKYEDAIALIDSMDHGFVSFACHSQCFDGWSSSYPDSEKTAYPATFIERMQRLMEYANSHGWVYMTPAEAFRKTVARYGDLGWATPFNIINGTETNPYYIVSGDGTVRHS